MKLSVDTEYFRRWDPADNAVPSSSSFVVLYTIWTVSLTLLVYQRFVRTSFHGIMIGRLNFRLI